MNISVSNIAWNADQLDEALALLKKYNIHFLDVAPTLLFGSLEAATEDTIREKLQTLKSYGVKPAGMQSLLYNGPPVSLFEGDDQRNQLMDHLSTVFVIAEKLGTKALVFGSPKNRTVPEGIEDPQGIAIDFFRKISDAAQKHGLTICMEANPAAYNCNFINTTEEALELIDQVDHPHFKLNLDTSTMLLNDEPITATIEQARKHIGHVHISAPHLHGIDALDHEEIAAALKTAGFEGCVALEMKSNVSEDNIAHLEQNLQVLSKFYG